MALHSTLSGRAILPRCLNRRRSPSTTCHAAQVLIAVGGRGYYQIEGQEPKELKAGQAVCIPADTKHWHGAAPDEAFSHLAFMVPVGNPSLMGNEWLEPVDAEAYGKLD